MTRMSKAFGGVIAGLAMLLAAPATAQTAVPAAPVGPGIRPAVLDADAAAALDAMGAYLRTLQTFQVTSHGTTELVFASGQKLQFQQRTTYTIAKPDQMLVEIRTDRQNRRVYYDGKIFTIAAPNAKLYTQFSVTGTVGEVLAQAYEDWGVDFPLQDLFRWGDPTATAAMPSEGFKVGPVQIGDIKTDHYAFRQPGVDFQIWIDQGDKPLPRRMVITNTEDAAQPQYVANFTWDLAPRIAAGTFSFSPGNDDKRIDLSQAAAVAGK